MLKAKLKNALVKDQISQFRPRPGEVLIDCGANIGGVTARLWRPSVEVHAFEPNPYAFAVLSRRFRRFSNVKCFNQAVLDRAGRVELYLHKQAAGQEVEFSQASSLIVSKSNIDPSQHISVEAIDLAAHIASLKKPVGLLKMDIEGVEYDVLEALINTGLIHRIRHILAEPHEDKMPEIAAKAARVRGRIKEMGLTGIDLHWH